MLLVTGCSFVWGDELDGCENETPTHWELGWPHILAEQMGMEHKNIAMCGNGNDKIFRDLMKFLRTSDQRDDITHLVVLWSSWERTEIAESYGPGIEDMMKIRRKECMTQTSPARINLLENRDIAQAFDYLYDHHDILREQMIRGMSYMTQLQWLCERFGIKLVQGVFHYRMWEEMIDVMKPFLYDGKHPNHHWGEWMNWIQQDLNYLRDTSRFGLNRYTDLATIAEELDDYKPQKHPGEKCQPVFANLVKEAFDTL